MNTFSPSSTKIKHKSNLIPDDFRSCGIIGGTRTGKTSLLPKILSKLHPYKHLIFMVRHPEQKVYQHILRHSKEQGAKNYVYTEPDITKIERLSPLLKESPHNVLIVDDFIDKKALEPLVSTASAGRHLNLSCYYLIQDFFDLPKDIRLNLTEYMILPNDNFQYMLRGLPAYLSNKRMTEVYNEVTSEPYQFLYICKDAKHPALRVRRGFNGVLPDFMPPKETEIDEEKKE